MKSDEITLDCPLCAQKHRYVLRISRMSIRYMNGEYGPWYEKEFTRLFVCPTKSNKFEATLVLEESREDKILSVEADVVPPDSPVGKQQ